MAKVQQVATVATVATSNGVDTPETAAAKLAQYEAGTLALPKAEADRLRALVKSVQGSVEYALLPDGSGLQVTIRFGDPNTMQKSGDGKRYLARAIKGSGAFTPGNGVGAGTKWYCRFNNGSAYVIEA